MAKQPLHKKISDELRLKIDEGELAVDEKIPSENELCEQFSVSRLTVRRSLQTLEQEGLIYRCQGLGAFVKDQEATKQMIHLSDFEEDMIGAGMRPESKVLLSSVVTPTKEVLRQMHLQEGTKVFRLDRLRLGNERPVAFDTTWLPMVYGQLIADENMADTTIYKVLEEKYHIDVVSGKARITAALPDEDLCRHLDIEAGNPLLLFRRTSYTENEKLIYYQERYIRPDRMAYEVFMERNEEDKTSGASGNLPLKHLKPVFE